VKLLDAKVREMLRGIQRSKIPRQFLANIILNIGHEVRQGAYMEEIGLPAQQRPDSFEPGSREVTFTGVDEFDRPLYLRHRRIV